MAIIIEQEKGGFSYKRDTIGFRVITAIFPTKKTQTFQRERGGIIDS